MALGCMKRLITACLSFGIAIPAVADDVCDLYQRCLGPVAAKRYHQAVQLFEQGDKQNAMVTMGEIYHESPSNQLLANNYAVMLAAVGQHAEAALVLEDYLQQDPSVSDIAKNLVNSYNNLSLIGTPAANMTAGLALISPEDTGSLPTINTFEKDATPMAFEPSSDFQQLALDDKSSSQASEMTDSADLAAVRQRLDGFLAAWSAGDIDTYLSFFKADTSPVPNLSYTSWRKQRYARVTPSKEIQVSATDVQTSFQADGKVVTEFSQFYRSANYQDRVLKSLVWENTEGDWRIISERQR